MDNPFRPAGLGQFHFLPNVTVYKDEKGEWRWQVKSAGNHKIIAASSEGFDSKRNALNNLKLVADQMIAYFQVEKDKQ